MLLDICWFSMAVATVAEVRASRAMHSAAMSTSTTAAMRAPTTSGLVPGRASGLALKRTSGRSPREGAGIEAGAGWKYE